MRLASVALLLLLVLMAPLDEAQPSAKLPRVGVISERSSTDPFLAAFRQGLRELGYVEGQNIVVEYRYADGVTDRLRVLTADLLRRHVDVLVVGGTVAALAAKAQTTTVPIVFTVAGDPVGSGLVKSLAQPGGNVTGMASLSISAELSGKQLELLKTTVPQVSRVTVLYNPTNPATGPALEATREVARALVVEVQPLEIRRADQLGDAFAALTAWRAGALLVFSDPTFGNELGRLAGLALKHRLPAIYPRREFAEAGGLLAYGASFPENYRRVATYVDKILKGATPAELPVQLPTQFELVINLKTAKAIGLTMPQSLLLRADKVIQ